jgi:hypothetical protein
MDPAELRAGDIVFATTGTPEDLGIPEPASTVVARPFVYDGNGHAIDVDGADIVQKSRQSLNELVNQAATVVVFRHHVEVKAESAGPEPDWEARERKLAQSMLEQQEKLGNTISAVAQKTVDEVYLHGLGNIVELAHRPDWFRFVPRGNLFSLERLNLPFWIPVPEPFFCLDYPTWRRKRSLDLRRQVRAWTGHVNLGTTRQGRFFRFYCSGFFLGVCHLAATTFLTFDPTNQVFRPRRPMGYVGHLKFEL